MVVGGAEEWVAVGGGEEWVVVGGGEEACVVTGAAAGAGEEACVMVDEPGLVDPPLCALEALARAWRVAWRIGRALCLRAGRGEAEWVVFELVLAGGGTVVADPQPAARSTASSSPAVRDRIDLIRTSKIKTRAAANSFPGNAAG